jgi:hypothetical protein
MIQGNKRTLAKAIEVNTGVTNVSNIPKEWKPDAQRKELKTFMDAVSRDLRSGKTVVLISIANQNVVQV